MTERDSGEQPTVSAPPASPNQAPALSYGNIYTPHAGSMIIQVQRESGLQSRTIVLGPAGSASCDFIILAPGRTVACSAAIASAHQSKRPASQRSPRRISRMEHTARGSTPSSAHSANCSAATTRCAS